MTSKTARRKLLLAFALLILAAGSLIYLFFRPHNILVFKIIERLGLDDFFRQRQINEKSMVQLFFVYSLPNGFWLLSYLVIQGLIWKQKKKSFYLYAIAFTGGSLFCEVLQKYYNTLGTFDIADVVVLIAAGIAGVLIYECVTLRVWV